MKVLHGIVKDKNVNTIVPVDLDKGIWENGEWEMANERAGELVAEGGIMLHDTQSSPSRHGGRITDARSRVATRQTKRGPQQVTLWTFTYTADDDFIGKKYTGTWGQNMIVEER